MTIAFKEKPRARISAAKESEASESFTAIQLLDGPALATSDPPLEYLVEALGMTAGSGAPHMFAGYGFSGKTMAAQEMALSLAAGRTVWSGLPAASRRVVHVDLEQGQRLTKRRYRRLAYATGVNLGALEDRLVVTCRAELQLVDAQRARWLSLMQGRDLLILDSWRAACPSVEENSSDVRKTLDLLGSLSEETGCRALVIHHARKPNADSNGDRFAIRGSSGFYDGCDAIYVFSAGKDEPTKVACEKAREHGELVSDLTIEIADTDGEFGPKSGLQIRLFGSERLSEVRQARAEASRTALIDAAVPKIVGAVATAFASGAPLTSIEAVREVVHVAKAVVSPGIQAAISTGQIHRFRLTSKTFEFRPGSAPNARGLLRTIADSSRTISQAKTCGSRTPPLGSPLLKGVDFGVEEEDRGLIADSPAECIESDDNDGEPIAAQTPRSSIPHVRETAIAPALHHEKVTPTCP